MDNKNWFNNLFNKRLKNYSLIQKKYFDMLRKLTQETRGLNKKNKFSAIFVLATDIKSPAEFKEKDDKDGALDKRFRLDAVKHLYNAKKVNKIILVGGYNPEIHIWRTEVMKKYLSSDIPEENLIERKCHLGNTCGNIIEIVKYIKERKYNPKQEFGLITNLYHIPRFKRLAEHYNSVYKKKIEFIPAEMILKKGFKNFYKNKEMKRRFFSEIKGLQDIEDGFYNCRSVKKW